MWTVKLTPTAKRQLKRLDEDIREDAGLFPSDKIQLRKHERYERVKFARNRFRMVYRIDRKNRRVLVTVIRERDANTYKGF